MTFMIIAAGIDLSIGSLVVFSSVAFAEVMTKIASTERCLRTQPGASRARASLSASRPSLVAGLGWGLVNGYLIGYRGIPAFVVTLGTLGVALGLAQVWTGGHQRQRRARSGCRRRSARQAVRRRSRGS